MRLFRTFQRKLLFFFLGLYVLAQVAAYLAVTTAGTQAAQKHIDSELSSGAMVFDQVIQVRIEQFLRSTSIISRDLGFKTAFGSRDRATLLAVMKNHMARLKADALLVVSLKGNVIADTRAPLSGPATFPFSRLIAAAGKHGSASGMAFLHGSLYRLVVVPLEAPLPVAWVVAGFRIDDVTAREFKRLTGLDVTFFVDDGVGPVVSASTVPRELQQALGAAIRPDDLVRHETSEFALKGEQFLGLARDVSGESGQHVTVLMQRSLDDALQPFRSLMTGLALLFTAGLLLMIAGSMIISSRITRPIRRLAEGAHSIERGDYTCVLPVDAGQDEMGRLSNAFNLMREAIRQREEQIRQIATYDALTGLVNRSHLYRCLESAIASACDRGSTLALIIMNIERFNEVVATLGHAAGTAILKDMAPLLRAASPSTALIARFGGDLFAVLLTEGAGEQEAVKLVQDVQKRLETPIWVGNAPVQIEARFGITTYPCHGADADMLLRLGDVAVHLAKGTSCGYAVYSSELDKNTLRHLTLLAELRRAIDRNELLLYYQPKVNILTGRVTGVEALLRWPHSDHGFVSPDEFIRLSEGTGLIRPVTEWTLRTGIAQCAELSRHGIPVNVGINLSARVLPDQHLPDLVSSLFQEHSIDPRRITLEVTETAVMGDPARTLDVVTRLDATGALLCIDDFGIGYSSLSYLRQLPVDELKIDKSFVQQMDSNENDEIIVHSIIELGHNLGLKVTAEGVERRQVWEMLRSRGCDVAQGYLHGKPMPLGEFIAWSKQSPWGLGEG